MIILYMFVGIWVFAILMIVLCAVFDVDSPLEIPEELWDYFTWTLPDIRLQKRIVLKHKKGDMSGIAELAPGDYINPDDVVCRKITLQDVVDTNLDLLTYSILGQERPATLENKVRELAQSSRAMQAVLDHWKYDSSCKLPEELLEAILSDEGSLSIIADELGCGSIISYMEQDGNELAKKIMDVKRERKEKKAC